MAVAGVRAPTAVVRTHAFLPPSAATRWRYVVRSCRELHYAYQRPLSFKNFYFPLFEYANVLSIVIQSHLASTPSCCCPILVSLHLSVSFSCKQKQKKNMQNGPDFFPPAFYCVSVLQYLLFQGIIRFYRDYPACSNTPL